MGRLRGGRLALIGSILFVTAGCDTRTTSVRVADPAKVFISSGSTIVLPADDGSSGTQRNTLREDSFETEPGAKAHYKIDAVRENGELALEWTTKVPILNGEHQTLIDRTGTFNEPSSVIVLISPDALKRDNFRIDACAELEAVSAKGVSVVGYRATEWNTCRPHYSFASSKLEAPFSLQTPWSNVVEIRDHIEVSVPGDIAIGIFGLGMAGGGAALIAVPKNCIGCVIGGGLLSLIGALTSLEAVLDISNGSRDLLRYPAKKNAP
jgi:hypothetical protein